MNRRLTLLFAVTAGVAVGNLYWAQPLLGLIAGDLGASAGWVVTTTQLGYAVGVLLIVPLGDVRDRRTLLSGMLLCCAVALLGCALAPTIGVLLVATTALGLTTVAGPILMPLAGDLASDAHRGRVVGTVASGLLIGILGSRTVSGLLADAAGWRAVFAAAAVVTGVLAAVLHRALPSLPPKASIGYPALIGSLPALAFRDRVVRRTLALTTLGFAVFSMFWTSLTFLLSAPPFSFSVSVIGLFGLVGLAGAVAARNAGRLHDAGRSIPATGMAWLVIALAFGTAAVAGGSVILLVVAIVLLDVAFQTTAILNQTRILATSHAARSRLNTAFVVASFTGAALGSALATTLWPSGGWPAITTTGIVLSCVALAVWATIRPRAYRPAPGGP
ncbi:putative MFS family arabinose efflux permease [Asanoa ferruginea]|uniref:Putative MFS family arabinose efflux permease n=1 Tax=Asanoa ferruginea TaxID=53367 RepID=A0A3D9ZYJ9_9ACTN|nr:MFS transporter [Asanoa ferruginea]REG02248.1 putative MFS family arabinose efflux permease [Asanoa ferruginea]GIF46485.1 MFS transporter [Asanoa ferruginea]